MAEYEIFREQLAIKYPSYGYALWEPRPTNPNRPVQVGDVGFIREGRFYRLFNALLQADDSSQDLGVPENHEPLVPALSDHVSTVPLGRNNYCSAGVKVEVDPGHHASPGDFPQVLFRNVTTRAAAVLSLPVTGRHQNTLIRDVFGRWMVKHVDTWFAFARNLGLVRQMEEIILVTGCDLTRSWTNVAFLGGADGQVSFGVKTEEPNAIININFQYSPEHAHGAILHHGPEGPNLPENQCVFVRGFRVAPSLWILPKRLKAAAGPSSDPGGYDSDQDMKLTSIPAITEFRDPLRLLSDYIAEQATDCAKILVHDEDLSMIHGLGSDTLPETLKSDVVEDLFRESYIKIYKFDPFLTESQSGPNTDTTNVKVATLSMTFQDRNLDYTSHSVPSRISAAAVTSNTSSTSRNLGKKNQQGPILLVDGYISHSFGSQSAERHFCHILKSDAVPAPRLGPDGASFVINSPNQYPLVLDRRALPIGTVIKQVLWIPHTVPDRKQHVQDAELQMPIFFLHSDARLGVTIEAAISGRCHTLINAECSAPVGPQSTTHIRIGWYGYREFKRQVQIRDETAQHNTVTLSKFVMHVGRSVEAFLKTAQVDPDYPVPRWRIGEGGIQPHEIVIIGAIQVSTGSWMPILQLTRYIL